MAHYSIITPNLDLARVLQERRYIYEVRTIFPLDIKLGI